MAVVLRVVVFTLIGGPMVAAMSLNLRWRRMSDRRRPGERGLPGPDWSVAPLATQR